eukprot:768627-Hanusia_phi.AAC.1
MQKEIQETDQHPAHKKTLHRRQQLPSIFIRLVFQHRTPTHTTWSPHDDVKVRHDNQHVMRNHDRLETTSARSCPDALKTSSHRSAQSERLRSCLQAGQSAWCRRRRRSVGLSEEATEEINEIQQQGNPRRAGEGAALGSRDAC